MTALVEWMHPRAGRIRDVVCERHERELLRALTMLGIGCVGRDFPGDRCGRCAAEAAGVEARFYLGLAGASVHERRASAPIKTGG